MVAPFIDIRVKDAENLIYLVLSGLLPGPLCLLLYLTQHTVRELEGSLQLPRYHRHIHRFVLVCSNSCCFVPGGFRALRRRRLNSIADKPFPCLTPIPMTKGLLIFPSTNTLAWAPPSAIFTSRSIFLDIPKLTSDSRSFF